MARPLLSVICRGSSIDSRSNVISLFEIMEEVQVQLASAGMAGGTNIAPFELHIVHLVAREIADVPERLRMRCRVIGPSGAEIYPGAPTTIDLTEKQRFRVVAAMFGLPFEKTGEHLFVFEHAGEKDENWKPVSDFPVRIHVSDFSSDSRAAA